MTKLTFKQFVVEATAAAESTSDISPAAKKAGRAEINRLAGISPKVATQMATYFTKATPSNIVKTYNAFVEKFPSEAKAISDLKGSQVGPGEMVFYYLFDNIGVGGNQNIDLFLNGKPFAEVKAGAGSGDAVGDFEISPGGHPAVKRLIDDLEKFNDAYNDANGEDLPDWKAGDVSGSVLRKWRQLDFDGSTGGGIGLSLKSNGDLTKKGDTDPILNVNKDKTVSPLKKLLDLPPEEGEEGVGTIEDIIARWVDAIAATYLKSKKFFLISSKNLLIRYEGEVTPDMLDLLRITRGRPKAIIYVNGKPSASDAETVDEES